MKPESKCCIVQIAIDFKWHKSTMMKSMIKKNAEEAARQVVTNLGKLMLQFPFVVQKKPKRKQPAGEAGSEQIEKDDYTTEKALKAILTSEKPLDGFTVAQEMLVGLSATQIWEKYFCDDAELGYDKFLEFRGEKNIQLSQWEEVKQLEDAKLLGKTAKQMRTLSVVIQVKGNPMVKECPTVKTYYLIEKSATKLHMLVRNNSHNVPYCDSFQILEEFLFVSPDPDSQPVIKSAVLRLSFMAQWLKSTLMKSIINSNVQ